MTAVDPSVLASQVEGQVAQAWLVRNAVEMPDTVALRGPERTLTWREYAEAAARCAGGLAALGVGHEDRVLLFVRNRPEFHVVDLAALLLRATPISIYNSSSPDQIAYLAQHSRARVVVTDDLEMLGRVHKVAAELPALQHLVVVDDPDGLAPAGTHRYTDLDAGAPVDLDAAAAAARPDDLVTVIYTSGTTGAPKGVMLDHRNITWQLVALNALVGELEPGRRVISYLPMAHIAERMVGHYNSLWSRLDVTTCADPTRLAAMLPAVRPHSLFGPPRVWEKLRAGILAKVAAGGVDAEAKFAAALGVGAQVAEHRAAGTALPAELATAWEQVDAAAFAPIRAALGLDELDYAFTGAAPIPAEAVVFFRAMGMPFSEIYGMSENTGGMTWDPYAVRPGTVGRAYPGVEVRLGADGEVLCRGGVVSRGYLDDPERTAETFGDGWLHSGDIGRLDDDGYLTIVDRKKELIITAGGKNVSPANIEAALKTLPLVGQACVVGDNQPYLVALLVLDPDVAPAWARSHGLSDDLAALAGDATVRAELERGVTEVNAQFNRVEQVKRFVVLGEEWLPDSEMLTATMKLKRRGVHAAYAERIADLYADPEPAAPTAG